jgi:hypothetical protein
MISNNNNTLKWRAPIGESSVLKPKYPVGTKLQKVSRAAPFLIGVLVFACNLTHNYALVHSPAGTFVAL